MDAKQEQTRSNPTADTRILIGIIADEETTLGFLLAGIGECSGTNKKQQNFMMVTKETPREEVQKYFLHLNARKNIGVIIVGSDVYKWIEQILQQRIKTIPIVLEIPTKNSIL